MGIAFHNTYTNFKSITTPKIPNMAIFPSFPGGGLFQGSQGQMTDAFGNPINPSYSNPNWGIDPSLLTPSYQAPYRPQYSGSSPYNYYGRMGFFSGMNQAFNPFNREPYWGNPVDNNQNAYEAMTYRPADAAAWTGQRVIAPALAFGGAYRMLASRSFGGYFTGKGLAGAIGKDFGMGIGRGVSSAFGLTGAGLRGGLGAGLEMGMGVAGSVMGNMLLPLAAAQAALSVGQAGIWDPYINTRQTAQSLQRNFAGVSFADARGNAVTGGGLGYREATRMAQDITRQGINDMTFSSTQYREIADMAGRSGLMDNVKATQITQRVKDVAEQIKMIVAISKDPDIKNAIEELSKLNLAGADVTGGRFSVAANTYRGLGRYASEAGTSIQRLMNTVGAQGQYMFQSMGMTPYLGQMAAGNVYSSFAAAQRIGLMSPAQLARMGGIEGATQASLMGQVAGLQSPYAMMAMYNQYLGGQRGSSTIGRNMDMISTLGQFGSTMARNPIQALGAMELYAPQMQGNMLASQGVGSIGNMAGSIMNRLVMPFGPNGKHTAEEEYVVLTRMMGMSPDQARAIIAQQSADASPEVMQQRMRGVDRNTREQMRQFISQNMAYGGALGQTARTLTQAKQGVLTWMSDTFVNPVTDFTAHATDWLTGASDSIQFGSTLGAGAWKVSDANALGSRGGKAATTSETMNLIGTNHSSIASRLGSWFTGIMPSVSAFTSRTAGKINDLAKQGDADARAFLSAKTDQEKLAAFSRLAKGNPEMFGEEAKRIFDPNNPQAAQDFVNEIKLAGTTSFTTKTQADTTDRLTKQLNDTLAGSAISTSMSTDLTPEGQVIRVKHTAQARIDNAERLRKAGIGSFDQAAGIGQAYSLGNGLASGQLNAGTIDVELSKPENAQLRAIIGNVHGAQAVEAIQGLLKNAAKNGTYELGQVMNDSYVDKAGNHGMTALINSKGALIQDAALRKQFKQALASGDKDAMNRIAMAAGITAAGGQVNGTAIKGDIGSFTNYMGAMNIQTEADQEKRDLVQRYKSNQIDFTTYQNTVNSLDQKKNVADFGDAVDKFAKAIDKMGTGTGTSGSGGNTGWSIFPPLFGGGSSQSNVPGDTTKGVGSRGPNSN